MDENNESAGTYGEIVRCWAEEREILGIVQPYTAQKAEQKASLFYPWLENKALEEIEPATIRTALLELRQRGGRFGKGPILAGCKPMEGSSPSRRARQ